MIITVHHPDGRVEKSDLTYSTCDKCGKKFKEDFKNFSHNYYSKQNLSGDKSLGYFVRSICSECAKNLPYKLVKTKRGVCKVLIKDIL